MSDFYTAQIDHRAAGRCPECGTIAYPAWTRKQETAARAMLAALKEVQEDYRELLRNGLPTNDEADEIDEMLQVVGKAIAQAESAGIKAED